MAPAENNRLKYWHPVLASRALKSKRPVATKLAGHSIALFRTTDGAVAAVADQCAHRRMKLSLGRVEAGSLVCPYHGWSFQADGAGESPSAPKLHACITSYDCAEAYGVIWIKGRESEQQLPQLDGGDCDFAGAVFNRARAPLELVIDNFSEVEHTVAMHPHFGFDPTCASEAVAELHSGDESVTVRNRGPAKMPPLGTRAAAAIRHGDHFHSDYTFRFDPPRSSVTHLWTDPADGRERLIKYHLFHYFVPEDRETTAIVSFAFLKIDWPLVRRLVPQLGWLFRRALWQTVEEDACLLQNLADKSPGLAGMKLSRFDSVLGLTRERLHRIYDGANSASPNDSS